MLSMLLGFLHLTQFSVSGHAFLLGVTKLRMYFCTVSFFKGKERVVSSLHDLQFIRDSQLRQLSTSIPKVSRYKLRGMLQLGHLYSVIVRSSSGAGGGEVGTSLTIASLFSAGDKLLPAKLLSTIGSAVSARQAKMFGE